MVSQMFFHICYQLLTNFALHFQAMACFFVILKLIFSETSVIANCAFESMKYLKWKLQVFLIHVFFQ